MQTYSYTGMHIMTPSNSSHSKYFDLKECRHQNENQGVSILRYSQSNVSVEKMVKVVLEVRFKPET